jgi:hypothetical protein
MLLVLFFARAALTIRFLGAIPKVQCHACEAYHR